MRAEIYTTTTPLSDLVLTTTTTVTYGTDTLEFTWLPAETGNDWEWWWEITGGQYDDEGELLNKYQELCESIEISCFDETYITFFVSDLLNGGEW